MKIKQKTHKKSILTIYKYMNMKGKILSVTIDHVMPFKALFEGLKDPLTDVNLEFIRPSVNMQKKKQIISNKNDSDKESSSDSEEEQPKKKTTKKTPIKDIKKKTPVVQKNTSKINPKKAVDKNDTDSDDSDTTNNKNNKKNKKKIEKAPAKSSKNKKQSSDESDKTDGSDTEEAEEDDDVDDGENKSNNDPVESTNTMSDGGIKIAVLDSSKTLFIYVRLDAKEFYEFYCKPPTYDIGINLALFYKIINVLERDDVLTISINEDDRQNLILEFKNNERNKYSYQTIKLIDIDKTDFKIPPTDFHSKVIIDTAIFHKICRDKAKIAEHLEIKCTRKQLAFSWKGDNTKGTTVYCNDDKDENGIAIVFTKNAPGIIQGIFDLKYLVLFTKFASLCPEVTLNMKNNYPLVICYKIASLGYMQLCLTPIVEDTILNNFDVSEDEKDLDGENDQE